MNGYYIVSFVYHLMWMIVTVTVLNCLFVRRFVCWIADGIVSVLFAGIFAVNEVVVGHVFSHTLCWIAGIATGILACCCYRGKKHHLMSTAMLCIIMMTLLELLSVSGVQYMSWMVFKRGSPIIRAGQDRGFFLIIWTIIYAVLAICIRKKRRLQVEEKRIYLLIDLFNVIGCLMTVYFTNVYVSLFDYKIIIIWILFVASTVILFMCITWMNIAAMERRAKDLIQMKNQMLEKNLNVLAEDRKRIEVMRHDLKKHLILIEEMARKGDSRKILDYVEPMTEKVVLCENVRWTGVYLVDAVIHYMKDYAASHNCPMEITSDGLEGIQDESEPFCLLLFNLLENAVEACDKIEQGDRWIRLVISKNNQTIGLQIKNPIVEKPIYKDERFQSSKKEGQLHGWGLESVRQIVERLNGYLGFKVDECTFEVYLNFSYREDKSYGAN